MAFLGVVSWSLAVDTLRLLSICAFLVCSLSFTWYSFISLIAVLGEPLQLKTQCSHLVRTIQGPWSTDCFLLSSTYTIHTYSCTAACTFVYV